MHTGIIIVTHAHISSKIKLPFYLIVYKYT